MMRRTTRGALRGATASPPRRTPRASPPTPSAPGPTATGGGHASFTDTAYDCSGAVSFALGGGRLLDAPLPSTALESWGLRGAGTWITVYANGGHASLVVAGLRFDTSGTGGSGPRWHAEAHPAVGFTARHPLGL